MTIQNLIGSGMDPKTENNPYLGFIYTSFQVCRASSCSVVARSSCNVMHLQGIEILQDLWQSALATLPRQHTGHISWCPLLNACQSKLLGTCTAPVDQQ